MKQPPLTLDATTGLPLSSSVSSINSHHLRATAAADVARAKTEEAAHYAILAGLGLLKLKETTQHGQWGKLFSGGTFDFAERTAQLYMQAANAVMTNRLTARKATALQDLATKTELDQADRVLLNEATHGQTYRQLLLDLDIIRPTQEEALQRGRNTAGGPKKAPKPAESDAARRMRCDDALRAAIKLVRDILDDDADLDASPDVRRVFVMELTSAVDLLKIRSSKAKA